MPDFAADSLAHALAQAARIAEVLGKTSDSDPERTLAEVLFEAAASAGYRCPTGDGPAPRQTPVL